MDLTFIKHLEYQIYDTAMVCIDIFTKYAAVAPIKGKTESDLAHGMIECFAKMGKTPQILYTNGETGIRNSGLFQKYFDEHKITVHFTRTHPVFAERLLGPSQPCLVRGLILEKNGYNNNKLVHFATNYTPKEATKPINELKVYVNLKPKAKKNRKYLDLNVGDMVRIYTKRKPFDKSHISVWSIQAYRVEEIVHSRGFTFYITSARDRAFLRNGLLKSTSMV